MSRGNSDHPTICCPYFNACEQQSVYCEGVEEGSRIRLAFSKKLRFGEYRQQYCEDEWRKCRIAKMLEDKWTEFFEELEE